MEAGFAPAFVLLLCALVLNTVSALPSFTTTPKEVKPGQTASLKLKCSAKPEDLHMNGIISVAIFVIPDNPPVGVPSTNGSTTTPKPVVVIGGNGQATTTSKPAVIIGGNVQAKTTTKPQVVIGGNVQPATTKQSVVVIGANIQAATTKQPVVVIGVQSATTTKQPVVVIGPAATTPKPVGAPVNPTQSATTTLASNPLTNQNHPNATVSPQSQPHMVALIQNTLGIIIPPNVTALANGSIGLSKNESTLVVTINNPTESDVGKYQCKFQGYNVSQQGLMDYNMTTNVNLHNITSGDISSTVARLEKEINEIKARWERVDGNKVFYHSAVFRNRKYSLSRRQVEGVDLCQFICSVQGGYLAEINDQAEFDFVRNFTSVHLDKVPNYPEVFLGATDHGQNTWKFLTNPTEHVYLGQGIPSNGYNCMSLSQLSGFNLNAYECDGSSRFLCEIPML